jgi:hypothetical protein
MVSCRHTNGNGIYLPVAPTSAMFLTCFSRVAVSNNQKQSASDAIQNVVLPPSAAPTLCKVAWREFAGAKVHLFNEFYNLSLAKNTVLPCLFYILIAKWHNFCYSRPGHSDLLELIKKNRKMFHYLKQSRGLWSEPHDLSDMHIWLRELHNPLNDAICVTKKNLHFLH